MTDLSSLGFEPNVWYETIVTTYNDDHRPNAAAMGCITFNQQHLVLRPFKNTATYSNIMRRRRAAVNITHDPELFYRAVFKKEMLFTAGEFADVPVLKECDAAIEVIIDDVKSFDEQRAEIVMSPTHIHKYATRIHPYSRVESALIESLIHYTRVAVFLHTERHGEALNLIEKIRENIQLVRRLSKKPMHLQICEEIINSVKQSVKNP
ncbi:MAG: DUF447 family protein [Candidatus Caldarchaeum sp.]